MYPLNFLLSLQEADSIILSPLSMLFDLPMTHFEYVHVSILSYATFTLFLLYLTILIYFTFEL